MIEGHQCSSSVDSLFQCAVCPKCSKFMSARERDNVNEDVNATVTDDANMASGEVNDEFGDSDSESDAQTLMLPGGGHEVVPPLLGPEDEHCNDWWHPSAWAMEELNYRYMFMDIYIEVERL